MQGGDLIKQSLDQSSDSILFCFALLITILFVCVQVCAGVKH